MENKDIRPEEGFTMRDYATSADAAVRDTADRLRRISWGAIFAGVLVAVVVQLALSLLGLGIGLSTVDATEEARPAAGLGTGSAIWYTVSSLLALFAGGWVAGRLARTPRATDGVIHGIVMWSLVTVFSFYLLTTAVGRIVGGVGRIVGGTLSTVGQAAGMGAVAAAANNDPNQDNARKLDLQGLKGQINQVLAQTGKPELQPGQLGNRAENAVDQILVNPQSADEVIGQFFGGDGAAGEVDREAVVNLIVARTGKSRQEANRIADNWMQSYGQAKQKWQETKVQAEQKARETADQAADALSTAAILAFVGLLLGAIVSAIAARIGNASGVREVVYTQPSRAQGRF